MLKGEFDYYIAEPAKYEARGDHIIASWGNLRFVMPIAVAQKAVARLNRALDLCVEARSKVVAIRGRH